MSNNNKYTFEEVANWATTEHGRKKTLAVKGSNILLIVFIIIAIIIVIWILIIVFTAKKDQSENTKDKTLTNMNNKKYENPMLKVNSNAEDIKYVDAETGNIISQDDLNNNDYEYVIQEEDE